MEQIRYCFQFVRVWNTGGVDEPDEARRVVEPLRPAPTGANCCAIQPILFLHREPPPFSIEAVTIRHKPASNLESQGQKNNNNNTLTQSVVIFSRPKIDHTQ